MKNLLLLIFVFLTSCHKQTPKQENTLVTLNEKVQSIKLMNSILDKTIDEINTNPKYDNFILFVHGRGNHPQKRLIKTYWQI